MTELEELIAKKKMEQQRSKTTLQEYFHEFPMENIIYLVKQLDEESTYYFKQCWGNDFSTEYVEPQLSQYQRTIINDSLKMILNALYTAKRTSLESAAKQIKNSHQAKQYGLCNLLKVPIMDLAPTVEEYFQKLNWNDNSAVSNIITLVYGSGIYYSDQFTYDRLNESEKEQFELVIAELKSAYENRNKISTKDEKLTIVIENSQPIKDIRRKYFEIDFFPDFTELEKKAILGILKQKKEKLYLLCSHNKEYIETEAFDKLQSAVKELKQNFIVSVKRTPILNEEDKKNLYALSVNEWREYFPENTSELILPSICDIQIRVGQKDKNTGLIPYTIRTVINRAKETRGVFLLNDQREELLRNILSYEDNSLARYYHEYIASGRKLPDVKSIAIRKLREWDERIYQRQRSYKDLINVIVKHPPVLIGDYNDYIDDFNRNSLYYKGCKQELEQYQQNKNHSCCGIEAYCLSKSAEIAKRNSYQKRK